jgi:hypothetical protein
MKKVKEAKEGDPGERREEEEERYEEVEVGREEGWRSRGGDEKGRIKECREEERG